MKLEKNMRFASLLTSSLTGPYGSIVHRSVKRKAKLRRKRRLLNIILNTKRTVAVERRRRVLIRRHPSRRVCRKTKTRRDISALKSNQAWSDNDLYSSEH